MAVRHLLWGCPICRAPGAIAPDRRHEACTECGTAFRRGRGARIVAVRGDSSVEKTAREWLDILGPIVVPDPGADGVILGPEAVRVKISRRQEPLRFGRSLLGWVEVYEPRLIGTMTLSRDGLRFQPSDRSLVQWRPDELKGIQPASSAIQIAFDGGLASVKFVEGAVRLWTRALDDIVREHYRRNGQEVIELQPLIRTRPLLERESA